MPRKKLYTDIHIRIEKSRLQQIDRMLTREGTRTDFIRHAIDMQLQRQADEMASPYYGQVLNYMRTFQDEVSNMLVLCWRAAAESIAVDMEVYRLTSADQIPPEVMESLRERAKKESEEWAKHVKSGLAIDLSRLKRDRASSNQLALPAIETGSESVKSKSTEKGKRKGGSKT